MLGDAWHYPPQLGVSRGDLETVRLWLSAGGLEGPRMLPQAGGLLDQAALMMDAWNVTRSAAAEWRDRNKPPA